MSFGVKLSYHFFFVHFKREKEKNQISVRPKNIGIGKVQEVELILDPDCIKFRALIQNPKILLKRRLV